MTTPEILKPVLVIFTAFLFFSACEKDVTPKVYDRITGQLSPGENITAEDLNGMEIYLGRFHDSVDFSNITFQTIAIDSVAKTKLDADGSFSFSGLTSGNYALALQNEFIFSVDTALVVNFDGSNECFIQKEITRFSPNNMWEFYDLRFSDFKDDNLNVAYKLKKINYFVESEFARCNDIHRTDWSINYNVYPPESKRELELEFWEDDMESKKIISPKFILYKRNNTGKHGPWIGDLLDIKWIPCRISGWLFWKEETPGYYEITLQK